MTNRLKIMIAVFVVISVGLLVNQFIFEPSRNENLKSKWEAKVQQDLDEIANISRAIENSAN